MRHGHNARRAAARFRHEMASINRNLDTRFDFQQWADSAPVAPPSSGEGDTAPPRGMTSPTA
jgi:hypothetical protein